MSYTYSGWDLDPETGQPLPKPGFNPGNAQLGGDRIGFQIPKANVPVPSFGSAASKAAKVAGVASPTLGIGLKAVGAVANYIGGGYARGVRKEGMKRLRGMYGKPVIDVNALTGFRRKAALADTERLGGQFDKAFGMDTGRGFGGFSKALLANIDQGAADAFYQNELETARRNLEIAKAQAEYA